MDLIYRILKQFRYIFRNRQIKTFITFALIMILLSMLCSRVFASQSFILSNDKEVTFDSMPSDLEKSYFLFDASGVSPYVQYILFSWDSSLFDFVCTSSSSSFYSWDLYEKGTTKSSNNLKVYIFNEKNVWTTASIHQYYDWTKMNGYNTNTDIYNKSGKLVFPRSLPNSFEYSVEIEPTTETEGSVIAYTNWLDYSFFSSYAVHIVLYPNTAESLNVTDLPYEIDNENNLFRYYFEIEKNGDYMFVFSFTYNDFKDIKTVDFTVSNIITAGGETGGGGSGESGGVENQTPDYTQNFNNLENAISGTTTAINETNNFLQNTTVDDSQFQMPTVEVNDPTANFFDTMFMGIYNAITTDEDKTINIPLLGSNFVVNSADFNFLQENEWSLVRIILSAMWVIGIGLYILKDIRKMIDKIKDGNIENVANDDIKADIV